MIPVKIALAVLGVIIFLALSIKVDAKGYQQGVKFRPIGVAVGGVILLILISVSTSIGQIEAGTRGVVLQFGAITGKTLNEGLYFIVPFVQSVEIMDVQTQAHTVPVNAASKDLQDVQTEVTLNYRLFPDQVDQVYRDLRRQYESRVINPAIQESVKAITAGYDAEQLITERANVKIAIEDALRTRLAKDGIEMITLSITNFAFSAAFSSAIEAKQVAAQRALEATNKLRQIEVEAQQVKAAAEGQRDARIAEAEGEKQSTILRAQGDSESIRLRSIAQSEANRVLSETLTDQLIRYTIAQDLTPGIQTIIIPAGQEFILGDAVLGRSGTNP
ncbi:MAG: prohibitin family protein [SAR202 cluster bacterium]|nr:prohibitin family protein [SAR202 cluster bacterium]